MALRAGVAVRELEFVQFHPTVLWRGPEAPGSRRWSPRRFAAKARSCTTPRGRGSWKASILRRIWRHAMSCPLRSVLGWPRPPVVSMTTSTSMRRTWGSDSPCASRPFMPRGRDRTRSGDRADSGRPCRSLQLWRHHRRARRFDLPARVVRRRRGDLHRSSRGESARVEQPHRVDRGRYPRRARPGVGVAGGARIEPGSTTPRCRAVRSGAPS